MSLSLADRPTRVVLTRIMVALLLAGALVGAFKIFDEFVSLRASAPIEEVAIERVILEPDRVEMKIRNDGPDPVRIAQVLINDAYWAFTIGDTDLGRLEATTIEADYPWEDGLPLNLTLVTSTGVTIAHEIDAASETPATDAGTFVTYALLGLYIGVLPVALGLFAFPFLRRISRKWLGFFLALTVGLLAFLLVDTLGEGLELAGEAGAALDGTGLFAIGALLSIGALMMLEGWLAGKRSGGEGVSGLALAYLIATGIGLHNFGEGLAVGAALAAGEVALGVFLVFGFALHNTTEGLAIVSPLGRSERRPPLTQFALLGLVAGAPTILGAWLGGFAFAPAWGALAFGAAAGAIAQVIWTVVRSMKGEAAISQTVPAAGFAVGLLVMYATGLLIA